ncbi:MAG: DUF4147 domain-containing protein [Rhizobiaceae bacterium]|nr:DUF4147 domain-containing protein [Rhizobiaceae bacterium]
MNYRNALELIWRAGVERVGGHRAVSEAMGQKPDGIIGVGKAATPMVEAALALAGHDTKTLLVTKYGHVICRHKANQERLEEYQNDGTLQVIEAGHPVPDENSLAAGLALQKFVEEMGEESHLLVLVSGGASSLAELLADDFSLEKLQAMNNEMLAQGLDIAAINERRKSVSLIKGGKLLVGFAGKKLSVLAISDVEGDSIETIGSGIGMVDKVSRRVEANVEIIASNTIARNACAQKARMLGFEICENIENAYGDVEMVAENIGKRLKEGDEGIYIFGGEPTVVLPENPGRGGRNQQLCLLLAREISGISGVEFLVAGSDGSDGPTGAAGGFGDGNSFAAQSGASDALANADGGVFLEKTGNLFTTGPTGTNVMDLIIAIKSDA